MLTTKHSLSLQAAKHIAQAAAAKACELKISIVISIYNEEGNLKYFERMDGTSYGSVRISQLKAKTTASLPLSSACLAERSASMPANPYASIPDILLLVGGLPIIYEGQHLGGIGISGATPQLDEECAQAGLDAFKTLK